MSNAPPAQFRQQGHRSQSNSHQGSNSHCTNDHSVQSDKSNQDDRMTLDPAKSILLSVPASPRPTSAEAKEHFSNQSLREIVNDYSHGKNSLELINSERATGDPQRIPAAPQISFHPPSNLYDTYPSGTSFIRTDPEGLDPEGIAASAKRKAFIAGITKPSARKGYIICLFCDAHMWGASGK